jgi:hypothetical protein
VPQCGSGMMSNAKGIGRIYWESGVRATGIGSALFLRARGPEWKPADRGQDDGGEGVSTRTPIGAKAMIGPAKHRLHDYEAGWLSMLVKKGLASERDARAAMHRVAQKAIDDTEARRERRRVERKRRRRKRNEG